jgi:hypothetical protein
VERWNIGPAMTMPAVPDTRKPREMQTRTHAHAAAVGRAASARRRIRRSSVNRLFCSTNGCATLMRPDAAGRLAVCPICGSRRLLH